MLFEMNTPETPVLPPVARRQPNPLSLHGTTLEDDYGWMRDKASPEVIGYLNAERLLKEHGGNGLDPATGTTLDSNPMSGLAPDRPWLRDWWREHAPTVLGGEAVREEAGRVGKEAGLATAKGFGAQDYRGAGSVAGEGLLRGFLDMFSRAGAGVTAIGFGGGGSSGLIHRASLGGGSGGGGRDIPDFGGGAGGSGSSAFDAIMRAEGTAGSDPYNTVLGKGKYGLPNKPLTEMTLREAYAFGRTVRARHGSSSALGAFQIVGRTMKQHMGAVGLGWDDKFSPENQRKLARDIARTEGLGAWEGFKSHPHERAKARQGGWDHPNRPAVQPYQAPRELQAHLRVDLDGRKVAANTTKHQFDSANGPATGANFADASELYPQVG